MTALLLFLVAGNAFDKAIDEELHAGRFPARARAVVERAPSDERVAEPVDGPRRMTLMITSGISDPMANEMFSL